MKQVKFNVIGIVSFVILSLFGFVFDIVDGQGGSGKVFSIFLIISFIIALVLFLKGTHIILRRINPHFHKIPLFVLTLILTVIQLIGSYIFSIVIGLGAIAPIMIRCGYYVTMP